MVRIKSNVYSHKRKKKVLKEARGQFGNRSKRYKEAIKSLLSSRQYAFYDRKKKKGDFRTLWIVRLNAACREAGVSYSRFIDGLTKANIVIDRKILSELAISNPEIFLQIVETAKKAALSAPKKVQVVHVKRARNKIDRNRPAKEANQAKKAKLVKVATVSKVAKAVKAKA